MSDALDKAEAAVREAAVNSAAVQVALAAVELAKTAQQPQHQGCHHAAPPQFDTKKWLTIGGLAIVGVGAASVLALAFALASVAVAIGGTCATACLLVLRSMWREYLKGR
jgi:hypothetical protein